MRICGFAITIDMAHGFPPARNIRSITLALQPATKRVSGSDLRAAVPA